LKKIR